MKRKSNEALEDDVARLGNDNASLMQAVTDLVNKKVSWSPLKSINGTKMRIGVGRLDSPSGGYAIINHEQRNGSWSSDVVDFESYRQSLVEIQTNDARYVQELLYAAELNFRK